MLMMAIVITSSSGGVINVETIEKQQQDRNKKPINQPAAITIVLASCSGGSITTSIMLK